MSAKRTGGHIQIKHTCQQPCLTPARCSRTVLTSVHALLARRRDNRLTQLTVRRQTLTITYQMNAGQRDERLVQTVERVGEMVSVEKTVPEVCLSTLMLPLKMKDVPKYFKRIRLERSLCRRGDLNPTAYLPPTGHPTGNQRTYHARRCEKPILSPWIIPSMSIEGTPLDT
jgi:hypothetical protein